MRGAARVASRANTPQSSPEGTTLTPRWHIALQLSPLGKRDEAAETAPRDVLEEHALHGILRAEPEDLLAPGLDELGRPSPEL